MRSNTKLHDRNTNRHSLILPHYGIKVSMYLGLYEIITDKSKLLDNIDFTLGLYLGL